MVMNPIQGEKTTEIFLHTNKKNNKIITLYYTISLYGFSNTGGTL